MTGLSASEDMVKGFDSGGIDYVTKPIDLKALIARIRAHLVNSRIAAGARQALDTLGQHSLAVDSEAIYCGLHPIPIVYWQTLAPISSGFQIPFQLICALVRSTG